MEAGSIHTHGKGSKALDVTEHNSGLAEIIAAQTALRRLIAWDEYRNEFVILRTDYLALITAMRLQGNRCFANEYDELRRIAAVFPHGVEFQHVKAHAGDPGNEKVGQSKRSRSNHGRFETRDPKQNLDIAQGYDSGYESDTGSLDGKGGYYEKQAAMPRTAYSEKLAKTLVEKLRQDGVLEDAQRALAAYRDRQFYQTFVNNSSGTDEATFYIPNLQPAPLVAGMKSINKTEPSEDVTADVADLERNGKKVEIRQPDDEDSFTTVKQRVNQWLDEAQEPEPQEQQEPAQ
ncbi:unnamed protein product, partial [Mesorhabditis spiculigera]